MSTQSKRANPFSSGADLGLKWPEKTEHIRSNRVKTAEKRSISVHLRGQVEKREQKQPKNGACPFTPQKANA